MANQLSAESVYRLSRLVQHLRDGLLGNRVVLDDASIVRGDTNAVVERLLLDRSHISEIRAPFGGRCLTNTAALDSPSILFTPPSKISGMTLEHLMNCPRRLSRTSKVSSPSLKRIDVKPHWP